MYIDNISENYFETIAVINGVAQNLQYHQIRMNKCLNYLQSLGYKTKSHNLESFIKNLPINNNYDNLIYRLKIIYNNNDIFIEEKIKLYIKKYITKFVCKNINFSYKNKALDRHFIDMYHNDTINSFGKNCETIFVDNNYLSDTSVANILLLSDNIWYTPINCLLEGTARARLLDENKIVQKKIRVNEIFNYKKIMIINALNDFDEVRSLDVNKDTIIII